MSQLQEPLKLKTFRDEILALNTVIVYLKMKEVILKDMDADRAVELLLTVKNKLNDYEEQPTLKHTTPQPLDNNY